VSVGVSL